jgi:hypothetical protein
MRRRSRHRLSSGPKGIWRTVMALPTRHDLQGQKAPIDNYFLTCGIMDQLTSIAQVTQTQLAL